MAYVDKFLVRPSFFRKVEYTVGWLSDRLVTDVQVAYETYSKSRKVFLW